MTTKRAFAITSIVMMASVGLSGVAAADTVSVGTTGPGSNVSTTINNSSTVNVTTSNNVTITNVNNQVASSGSANVSGNTVGGSATSGSASNNSSVSTVVAINNPAPVVPGMGNGGGVTPPAGGGSGNGGGVSASGGSTSRIGGAGGASIGAAGVLPKTGPTDPVDVSALRSQTLAATAPAPTLVQKTNNLSTLLLIAAAALSLLGAAGSAVYAIRQKRMV